MRITLIVLGALGFGLCGFVLLNETNAVQEIEALILGVIGTLGLGMSAIVGALERMRVDVAFERKQRELAREA